jgi:alpha-tubulin suppressor-like RCC1 family protein
VVAAVTVAGAIASVTGASAATSGLFNDQEVTVLAFGDNSKGQLPGLAAPEMDTPSDTFLPAAEVTAFSAGGSHGVAIIRDNVSLNYYVNTWGDNSFGQLGNGSTSPAGYPVTARIPAILTGGGFGEAAAGGRHSLATDFDGNVWAWGDNGSGQVGVAGGGVVTTPQVVELPRIPGAGYAEVAQVAAGDSHSLALLYPPIHGSAGTIGYSLTPAVYAWGDNSYGQLGDGTTVSRSTPEPVILPLGPNETVTGIEAGAFFSVAITSAGNVYEWGDNSQGQLGAGLIGPYSASPVLVALPTGVSVLPASGGEFTVAAGAEHVLALTNAGVYSWGGNAYGQLGDGTTIDRATPVPVAPTGTGATGAASSGFWASGVAAGATHSVATGGTRLYAWGDNSYGQLGDGTTVSRLLPEQVTVPRGYAALGVSAGTNYTLVAVEPQVLSVVLTSSQNPAPPGTAVTIWARATSNDGVPTGYIRFSPNCVGQNAYGPTDTPHLVNGQATCTMIANVTQTVTAQFVGDGAYVFAGSPSASIVEVAGTRDTTLTVVSSNAAPYYGQPVTFDAQINIPIGYPSQPGGVQFFVDGLPLGQPAPVQFLTDPGSTTCQFAIEPCEHALSPTTTDLTPGTHVISATYMGDQTYSATTGSMSQLVTQAGSAATITSNANPSDPGQGVQFTATIAGTAPPPPSLTSCFTAGTPPMPTPCAGPPPGPTPEPTPTPTPPTCSAASANCPPPPGCPGAATCPPPGPTPTPTPSTCSAASPCSPSPGCAGTPTCPGGAPATPTPSSSTCQLTDPTCTPGPTPPAPASGPSCAGMQTCSPPPTPTPTPSPAGGPCAPTDPTCPPTTVPQPDPMAPAAPPSGTVTFYVDGSQAGPPAEIVNGKATSPSLTSLSPGDHNISISYSGDANYQPIAFPPSPGTFAPLPIFQTVRSPSSVTIVLSGPAPVYGGPVSFEISVSQDPPPTNCGPPIFPIPCPVPSGNVTVTIDGQLLASQLALSGGQSATPAAHGLTAGSHQVVVSYGGDATFVGSSATLVFSVAPAPLVATISGSQTYGGTNLSFAISGLAGLVYGDTASVVNGAPSCITSVVATSPAGSYAGTLSACGGLNAANYQITYANGGFTVTQAPLTITAPTFTLTYADPVPSVQPSYSGFVNGESSSALSVQPACATQAGSTSAAGTYASDCAGAVDPNYAFSYVGGSVTVLKRGATLTYLAPLMVSTGSASATSATVTVQVQLVQANDGHLGNPTLAGPVSLLFYKSSNVAMTSSDLTCAANVSSSGIATCTVVLGADNWTVVAQEPAANPYFSAHDSDPAVLTVYQPVAGASATGGGWVIDPGTGAIPVAVSSANNHGNFGFSVRYKTGTTTPQGQFVYVFRGSDGYDYVIKSNSWAGGGFTLTGTSQASFAGKCNVSVIDPMTGTAVSGLGGGNLSYRVYVTAGSNGSSTLSLQVWDAGGHLYHQAGTSSSQISLGGGNVVVRAG